MEKLFGDFSEFLGLFIVFIFLILQHMKKKPLPTDEEPLAVPIKKAPPLPSTLESKEANKAFSIPFHALNKEKLVREDMPTTSCDELLPQEEKNRGSFPSGAVRLKGRQLLLSYEALSLPLSLRVPRV
jgi:hypothetical protein